MPRLSKFPFLFSALLFFIGSWLPSAPLLYAMQERPFARNSQNLPQQYSDTLRALIVFTRFKNDTYPGDPDVFNRNWPLKLDEGTLPDFAHGLLAPELSPRFADSSLTEYFYKQSLGNFILYGEPYDSVLVTTHDESHYHAPQGGYGDLTKELLDRIDSYGFDFSKYDQNRDGFVDYIFVVVRGDSRRDAKQFVWTGASCLDGRCTGTIAASKAQPTPVYDGKRVDWNYSGSYLMHRTPGNVSPFHYHIRLMAHEIGHDLWSPHFVHIPQNRTNDVPLYHNRSRNNDCVGYVLMAGSGGAWDCGGSETISAYERDLLGWIQCTPLEFSLKNIEVGDLFTTSDCFTITFSDADKKLYVSNLQRNGYFDRERRAGIRKQYQIGLRTTGMLVHLVYNGGVDVLPADNNLALGSSNEPYQGDLFGPGESLQLTPWTRPNINGFTNYPKSYVPEWHAIDNIRMSESSPHAMRFDYSRDFRLQPTFREDSWIGAESQGIFLSGPVTITNRSSLYLSTEVTLQGSLSVETASSIHIEPGGTLIIPKESVLKLNHGSDLHIRGTLILDGLLTRSPGAKIELIEGGRIVSSWPD